MEDLESKLSVFIGEVKSVWICTEIKDGESSYVHSGGYFASLFQVAFFPSGEL